MESGLTEFLTQNNSPYQNVTWAKLGSVEQAAILTDISTMLTNNIPVVFSYYTSSDEKKDGLALYFNVMQIADLNVAPPEQPTSHYMTITALEKYWSSSEEKYKYAMKIVSWGRVYYADLSSFMTVMDYFTNYLSVY